MSQMIGMREPFKRASSKSTSKIACISKVFTQDLLGRHSNEMPRSPERLATDYMRAPPSIDDINREMVPPSFKLSILYSYDGWDDPEDHLHTFIYLFKSCHVPDFIICPVFPVFLQGTAPKWLWNLEPMSVFSFDDLMNKFIHQFVSSTPLTNILAYLMNIQHVRQESLP